MLCLINNELARPTTGYKAPTKKDLIYYDESPDFCVANPKLSVSGTSGRVCNATSIDVDGE